jgi:hypothetical protein
VAHFLNKEGEDTLGKILTERKWHRSGRRVGSPTAALFGREMRRIERVREEEERLGRTGIRRQGDGLIGTVP